MKVIIKYILDWLLRNLVSLGAILLEHFRLKKRQDERTRLAEDVKEIETQIKALVREGKPVSEELKEKLREYSRRLADSINSYELH